MPRRLSCSKCLKRDQPRYFITEDPFHITWRNVDVVRSTGEGVECKCGSCGHSYISYSSTARNALEARFTL